LLSDTFDPAGGRFDKRLAAAGGYFQPSLCPLFLRSHLVCFVLEHLSEPIKALHILKDYLKPGGTITVIKGDHGSTYIHPDSEAAHIAIQCRVGLKRRAGGNAMIGLELYSSLCQANYDWVRVSPRMVDIDASKPQLVDGFTRKTFTAMIEGVRTSALRNGIVTPCILDQSIKDLYRTAERDGVFCYTFFKAYCHATLRAGIDRTSRPPRRTALRFLQFPFRGYGTAWLALFCQNMLELDAHDHTYENMVVKFVEHFYYIAYAMNLPGEDGMWDDEDGFYYNILWLPNGSVRKLKVRSMVGLSCPDMD
jgi:hypothetical protein